ncbi:MAG: PsbP-related protein [Actinomycetota bacterium]|nr:PsbP-related protein [Actinomycetota bacterium]
MENEIVLERQQKGISRGSLIIYMVAAAILALAVNYMIIRPFSGSGGLSLPQTVVAEKQFVSERDNFSLRYPAGWSPLSEGELSKYNGAFAFAVERNDPRVFFGLRVQTIDSKGVGLNQLAQGLDKEIVKNFQDAKKNDQEIVQLKSGRRALKYEYTFTSASKTTVREQMLIIPAGSKVYHLSVSADDKDFDNVRGDVDALIQGFEIK